MIEILVYNIQFNMARFVKVLVTGWKPDEEPPQFDVQRMKYMNYQREICPHTNKRHWQIYVHYKTNERQAAIKKDFGNDCHIEKVTADNGADEYCLKDETAVEGTRREFGEKPRPRPQGRAAAFNQLHSDIQSAANWNEVLKLDGVAKAMQWSREVWNSRPIKKRAHTVLKTWQQEEFDALQKQDDRQIRFIVDYKGGEGKSALGIYIQENLDAFYSTGGKIDDVMYSFQDQEYAVFDMARCVDAECWPFRAMEFLKNGMASSNKYMSCMKKFNPVKIIVMCNQMPDLTKLSADRYSIRELNELFNSESQVPKRSRLSASVNASISDD